MSKYAVFTNGTRQYKAQEGEEILVERVEGEKALSFDKVLLVVDDKKTQVGDPYVKGAKVEAQVLGEEKGKKLEILKFKAKSRYRRHTGHRHKFTRVKIGKITS